MHKTKKLIYCISSILKIVHFKTYHYKYLRDEIQIEQKYVKTIHLIWELQLQYTKNTLYINNKDT